MADFPNPDGYSDWKQWAEAVASYNTSALASDDIVFPQIVLLQHKKPTLEARATVDVLLMFDPVLSAMVVSIGGAWKRVTVV